MTWIQLYFDFDSEIIVDQWARNISKAYMMFPNLLDLKNQFENNLHYDENVPCIPMDFICAK